jgi:hypothetical protein
MERSLRPAPALALVLALTACASSRSTPGDRAYEAGDWAGAAAAYESTLRDDPAARSDPRLLVRLALVYARPDTPVYEPERAVEMLRDVAQRFPRTQAGADAALLLPQLEQEVRLAAAVASAARRIVDLEGELERARQEAQALDAAARARDDQLTRLRASLAEAQVQLRRVRDELEQLKRIDLQRRP